MSDLKTGVLALLAPLIQVACAQTGAVPEPLGQGWERDTTFYLVFVRSFADSTAGPLANDGVGDLRGLIERLDYLNDGDPETTTDLGVTGLWLMPIAQSPSYHGYDTIDYLNIDNEYGSNEDMKELVRACHERGIRVLVDLVVNHTSEEHPWFESSKDPESAYRDWYVWEESDPEQRGPWGQPVWHDRHSGEDSDAVYYGVFWHGMPDLNYTNPEVTQAMHDAATHWLTEFGVDGFRLDAIKFLVESDSGLENTPETIEWFRQFSEHVESVKPGAFMVGEVWDTPENITRYIDTDPPALKSCFDFPFAYAVMEGLRDGNTERIRKDLARSFGLHAHRASPFLSNHDMDRSMTFMGNSVPRSKAAATFLLTAVGAPFVYYGEELGMTGKGPHENIRTPMQWTSDPERAGFTEGTSWEVPNRDTSRVSVEAQSVDPSSLLTHYRELIRIRNTTPALRRGDLTMTTPEHERVVAYTREFEGQRVMVIVNTSDRTVTDFRVDATGLGLEGAGSLVCALTGQVVKRPLGKHPDMWRPVASVRAYASHVIVLD